MVECVVAINIISSVFFKKKSEFVECNAFEWRDTIFRLIPG